MNTQNQEFRLRNFDETINAWDAIETDNAIKTLADARKIAHKFSVKYQESVRIYAVELSSNKLSLVDEI